MRASPVDWALTLSGLTVMLLPGTPLLLGFLATLHVATVFQHLPDVFNHWYFAGLVSLSLLLGSAAAWWHARRGGAQPMQEALPIAFAPAARWSLLLLYFLSGFHKLNGDFFDPGVSCASALFERLSAQLGGLPLRACSPCVPRFAGPSWRRFCREWCWLPGAAERCSSGPP